ncbi:hydroxymethylbilane synthase [Aquimarina sp. MAR_2010_214]|uniref:hydroxymethylbilane synthase n=1 Tax=Aquimarina sp. MAR_2010_214 TaxID=1250026 RepID=UPI000C7146CA|nr:hydroxymethylbilane synthase [Aquimarina sp. MAR_2010_214]PKV48998.1 hydroxymethylbilane synthase [Aquimarina sp. MAR_2010_214]
MTKTIRIGTRDSELALWQANTVQKSLEELGYKTQLIPVKSTGDIILDKPLYELGITGIFTKTLDIAMLHGDIDIAVHSMKDVPTILPKGIVEAAILKRANVNDILVHKGLDFLESKGTIATGSLRRKAQWLHKYATHTVVDLRGNVNTRMQKLTDSDWNGAIFAAAGLERINLKPDNYIDLDWMIPAPAQGAMLVVAKEEDEYCLEALSNLNDSPSEICVHIEREFLRELEGGCTAPIGGLAEINTDSIHFKGALFSLDGKDKIEVNKEIKIGDVENLGKICAQEILNNGGHELMKEIKAEIA